MKKLQYLEILLSGAFVLLLTIFIVDRKVLKILTTPTISDNRTIVRSGLNYKEAMVDYLMPETIDTSYSLLDGVLPVKDIQTQQQLNSQTCFEGDFSNRLEKTGNYLQRTNNYRHKDAESCTSPYQEFIGAYYDVKPLA
jgi:hypothetical protein